MNLVPETSVETDSEASLHAPKLLRKLRKNTSSSTCNKRKKRKRQGMRYDSFWSTTDGLKLCMHHQMASRTSMPVGCAVTSLSEQHLLALRSLYNDFIDKLPELVTWGDNTLDTKQKGFGMVPSLSDWKHPQQLEQLGILLHTEGAELSSDDILRLSAADKHKVTVERAFTDLSPKKHQLVAIKEIIKQVNAILCLPEHQSHLQQYERSCVRLSNLVAIQPNIHNGADYLPLHVDDPLSDGFGVVIITVALWGTADVVLVDDGEPDEISAIYATSAEQSGCVDNSWAFPLRPGQLYVLSGPARNKCAHGVVVIDENVPNNSTSCNCSGRVSLTLRFGIHTKEQALNEFNRFWK